MIRYCCLLLLFLMPSVSSAMTTTWDKTEHIFRVSYPKMAVKVPSGFVFKGKESGNKFGFFSSGGESGTNINSESNLFQNKKEKKAIKIVIATLNRGYWKSNLTDKIKNPLDSGKMDGAGRSYQYAVTAVKAKDGGCILVNRFARIYGADKDTLVECYYIQQLDSSQGTHSKWQHPNTFSDQQRAFLSAFVEKSMKEMRFIK